ncbi:hypothetical protein LCGC14_2796970 [marine sediment metagenome]|uniref:Uncharacterized protein n=1 Tax=marine sediment metagenome TaxID=412755 RepID=A0A0F9AXI2_9ZZZZ
MSTLTLRINLDNASFRHDDETLDFGQVSESLHLLSVQVEQGQTDLEVRDDNGNPVGRLYITPDD